MKNMGIVVLCFFFGGLVGFSQSEDCSTEPSLIGGTLPINTLFTPMSDDFDMTAMSCEPFNKVPCGFQDGYDSVVCFTPSNNCEIVYQVATGTTNVALHVFAGACMEPDNCIVSVNADTIFSIFLDAGVQYCFVAERCGSVNMNVFIGEAGPSDCGIFLNPNFAFNLCPSVITNWNREQLSPCTGANRYSILDSISWLEGQCPCDFPPVLAGLAIQK